MALRDTVAPLRELDCGAPRAPYARQRRRRVARVGGLAAATAVIAALLMSVMTGNGSGPALVDAAYAARRSAPFTSVLPW